jgi:hypothetical protein
MTGEQQQTPEDDDKQYGKYGKEKHFKLVKAALIQLINKYYDKFAVISVEKQAIGMQANMGYHSIDMLNSEKMSYTLYPDIYCAIRPVEEKVNGLKINYAESKGKVVIIEAETTDTNLLANEMRLTVYKLLRMRYPDKQQFMIYLVMPIEFKGKVLKPDFFNDIWFFDLDKGEFAE